MSAQAELFPEPEAAHAAPVGRPFKIGQRPVRLEAYAQDCWRSVDPPGLIVRKRGRTWIAAFGVGLEYLGPYEDEMALCMARGVGQSLEEAEASLNAELELIRHAIGAPEEVHDA